MAKQDDCCKDALDLRIKAEAYARETSAQISEDGVDFAPDAMRRTLHELRVHQIELEMQNLELRQAQVEIEASRARYFNLYEYSPQGHCTLTEKGLILEANLTAATMLDLVRSPLIKQPFSRFILEQDQGIYYLHLQRLLETGEPQEWELRLINQDGVSCWVHMAATAAQEEGGASVCHLVIFDVTKIKNTTFLLRKSEKNHKFIVDAMDESLSVMDEKGTFLFANRNAVKNMLGDDSFDIIGKNIRQMIPPEQAEQLIKKYQQCLSSGQPLAQDVLVTTKTGERWFRTTLQPIGFGLGDIPAVLSIAMDITERKRADELLSQSYSRYELVLEGAAGGIWDWDIPNKRVHFSSQWKAMRGFQEDEISDSETEWSSRIHPEDTPYVMAAVEAHFAGKTDVCECEYRVRRKDGSYIWLLDRGKAVYGDSGQVVRMAGSEIDITERKQVEAEKKQLQVQLAHAQKMEAIGTLAGGIAHDFNNILGSIIGFAEIAREDSVPGSEVSRSIDRVIEAGNRAAALVKQILSFSRQQDGECVCLDPGLIVMEVVRLLRPSLPSTIAIKQRISATRSIFADPTQLHQVLMNLATNAFHAMEQTGGSLEVSIEDIDYSEADLALRPGIVPGHFVRLCVADTGTGIPEAIRERIFAPYFTTKEAGKGTGMGLAIVDSIVRNSGGFITCDSQPGRGTVFAITLPACFDEVVGTDNKNEPIITGGGRILFVDDEEILIDIGQTMLERLGYEVTVRTSSLDALNIFQSDPHRFDAVITDQTMPDMTGIDLARRMLQIRPDIPIILCTGYSSHISEEKVKSLGIQGFAMKPFTRKELGNLIRTILRPE